MKNEFVVFVLADIRLSVVICFYRTTDLLPIDELNAKGCKLYFGAVEMDGSVVV